MNAQLQTALPDLRELNVSNQLLGDLRALQAAWERDGYWFFRDVLDKDVIARVRKTYLSYLVDLGAVKLADNQEGYVVADVSRVPTGAGVNTTRLNDQRIERMITTAPTINAFFNKLFGCDPFWIPFTVHRTVAPNADKGLPRLEFIHHDSVYNEGLMFLICWIPLDVIEPTTGGLALVEGVHRSPSLHRKDGMKIHPIQQTDVPADRWRGTTYRPGDVLLMGLDTPHSGITNRSRDRFRLSMDTRIMPSNAKLPLVGTIAAVTSEKVVVRDERGEHTLRFDKNSFVRGYHGDQMSLSDVPSRYQVGLEVIAAFEGDRVTNLRPQT